MEHLTRRGQIVVALLGALLLWGIWYVSGHIWYVPGQGYCVGSMLECYAEEAGKW
jgi:hypothetical protein